MALSKVFIFSMIIFSIFCEHLALSCTDFRLQGKEGTVIITRSMEYAIDLHSNLRSSPRGRVFTTIAPDGKPGMSWKAKYGYLFLDAMNQDVAVDGINEFGLSFEALYSPNYATYQSVPAGKNSQALPYLNFGDWILSNFKTVEEVRSALTVIYVHAQNIPSMGNMIFPLHFAVYDASGKGIVIEYVHGERTIYNNKIGILTNSPDYSWHITNLENYLHLTTTNPNPILDSGEKFVVNGQGFGMLGLPGDISPPSRFVRISVLTRVAIPANNADDTLNLAEHIINNVDIPFGLSREADGTKYTNESTQWVVFKDLTHRVLYYRTYNNLSLRKIELAKVDFSENAARLKMSITSPMYIQDMTPQFLASHPAKVLP